MNEHDKSLLIKCLMLTTSDNDGEALNASRKANTILSRNNECWLDFFDIAEDQPLPIDWHDEIDRILARKLADKWRTFLVSVQQYYDKHGTLTDRQEAAVRKFMG